MMGEEVINIVEGDIDTDLYRGISSSEQKRVVAKIALFSFLNEGEND